VICNDKFRDECQLTQYKHQGKSVARYLDTRWCFWWCSKVREIKKGSISGKKAERSLKIEMFSYTSDQLFSSLNSF